MIFAVRRLFITTGHAWLAGLVSPGTSGPGDESEVLARWPGVQVKMICPPAANA